MEKRRQLVASLLVQSPRITQREVHHRLAGEVVNPATGEPYSLGTINNDIQVLRDEWREKKNEDRDEWISRALGAYDEMEKAAWAKGDLSEVRYVWKARRTMLGLDAPQRQEISGPEGGPIETRDTITLTQYIEEDAKGA